VKPVVARHLLSTYAVTKSIVRAVEVTTVSQPSPGFSRWKSFVLGCAGSGCGLLQPNPSPVGAIADSNPSAPLDSPASLPSIEDVGMVIANRFNIYKLIRARFYALKILPNKA